MVENNPFLNRNIITDTDDFFGRKKELRTIYSRLSSLQSCDVFGKRKIGKSSLLYHVFLTTNEKLGDEYRVAYIDLQNPKYHTPEGFLKYSLMELGADSTNILPSNSLNENWIVFSESIKELRTRCKPVLFIDECEKIMKKPEEFDNDFIDGMRSIGSLGEIAYVTSSLYSIKWLCKTGNFTSPFYNIFSDLPLGRFSPRETSEFLSTKRDGIEFNEDEIDFIRKIAKDNPLRLQISCNHVLENRERKLDNKKLKKCIAKEFTHFDDESTRLLRYILKNKKAVIDFVKQILSKSRKD